MALKILIPRIDFPINNPEKMDNPAPKMKSPPTAKNNFKAVSLKEGLTDFIYQDGKPIQIKVKPHGILYNVAPMKDECLAAGHCCHEGGWCKYYPIFVIGKR